MFRIACIIIGYLIGCFQTAYILGRTLEKIDIRNFGSGNAGTTNVIRVMGWKAGVITFIGDLLKGIIVVAICRLIFPDNPLAALYGGIAAVIGHNWPIFLNFKGGKGIATTIGVLLSFDYRIGLICIGIMIIIIGISRFVSLGSIIMAMAIPILFLILWRSNYEVLFLGIFLMGSALVRHRTNIKRLFTGNETKLGHRSNKQVEEK